jgi:hypothetical protein
MLRSPEHSLCGCGFDSVTILPDPLKINTNVMSASTLTTDPDFELLRSRPADEDTRIRHESYQRIGGIAVAFEEFIFGGIVGQSAIFLSRDVAGWSDERLTNFLREVAGAEVEGRVAISRRRIYTFVNFGFRIL